LTGLLDRIRKFRERIFQEEFNGNSVASMLREECGSLEAALESAQTRQHFGGRRSDFLSQVMQHEAYTHLGRGATVAVQQPRGEDPVNFNTTSYVTSPFASRTARRVVNLISTISIAPNDMDAVNEATQMSQNVSQVDDAHN
jgi:hypothetical protein